VVTVLLPEHLLPVRNRWLRRPLLALVGARLAGTARGPHEPGAALAHLPPGNDPASGTSWAAANPPVALSIAARGSAVDDAVRETLPAPARERAAVRIAAWNGEPPPLDTDWLDEATAGLPPADQAAVRLALLTAFAPHRAGDEAITAFRRHHPSDVALVGLLAWSAYHAAARIAGWLA
jgi:alkylhydroperoxidase family enzyme